MKKLIISLSLTIILLSGCDKRKDTASDKAAANGESMANAALGNGNNAEQKNIERRLKLTSQPGLIGYATTPDGRIVRMTFMTIVPTITWRPRGVYSSMSVRPPAKNHVPSAMNAAMTLGSSSALFGEYTFRSSFAEGPRCERNDSKTP